MKEIKLFSLTTNFAENKDLARDLRINEIAPALKNGKDVILDFEGIQAVTQSFIHALLSGIFREQGTVVLDKIKFKNCNENVKKIIEIVVDYMQESIS